MDYFAKSNSPIKSCIDLEKRADELFVTIGLECKGWTEEDPSERVTKDGLSLGAAGLRWLSKVNAVQMKNPVLHFGSRHRGKFDDKTISFNDKFEDNRNQVAKQNQVEGHGRSSYRGKPGGGLPLPQEGYKEKEAAWECPVGPIHQAASGSMTRIGGMGM